MVVQPTWTLAVEWPELSTFRLTMPEWLTHWAEEGPSSQAITDSDRTLSWSELEFEVSSAMRRLLDCGVGSGDVVVVQLPNWWETIVISLAVWRIGAVLNPVTPIYRGSELRVIFHAAEPSLVVCPGVFGGTDYLTMTRSALRAADIDAPVLAVRSIDVESAFFAPTTVGSSLLATAPVSGDVCLLMFTSGTTGMPKGVLHSAQTLSYEALSIVQRFSLVTPTVFMPSPLTHITGLLYGIVLPLLTGGRVVLQDRWDPDRAVDWIETEECTFSVGATPFLVGLTKSYEERSTRSRLEIFICGGADVPPDVIRRADEVMGTFAVRAYGLTELPTLTCGSLADDLLTRGSDDGALVGSAVARIVDPDNGVGELEAKAPEMFLGYLNPHDNTGAFTPDGWFKTGDLAELHNDRILIRGRKKDIICRGGENISPLEIENIIRSIPGIIDVAIVGVSDPILGERACAMIVTDGCKVSLADLSSVLTAQEIARQKFPEYLLACEVLPRTASGKIQKFMLRRSAEERIARGEGERR